MTTSLTPSAPIPHTPLHPFPHQSEAIDVCLHHFLIDDTPGSERAQIVLPCGTGKTLISIIVAQALAAAHPEAGAVLVVVPTLALLDQTVRDWVAHSPEPVAALAFCSEDDLTTDDYAGLPVPSTTDPAVLARWMADKNNYRVVFSTYQSSPQIATAHRDHELSGWAVVIADEAHYTVTEPGSAFATILDEGLVPAWRRLFVTATPRVRGGDHALSMADDAVYGRCVYSMGLREAIDRHLLAPYEVVVTAVTNADVRTILRHDALRLDLPGGGDTGLADAAKQVALLKVAADRGVQRVLVYHNQVRASQRFTANLPQIARAVDPATGPRWSVHHVDGATSRTDRVHALHELRDVPAGRVCAVSNVRVFTAGLDIPALDAVMFCDPRSSPIDIAQAVGRALRKHPDHARPALIVLPVLIDDDADAIGAVDESSFAVVVDVLRALMDHDSALAAAIAHAGDAAVDRTTPQPGQTQPVVTTHAPPQLARLMFHALRTVPCTVTRDSWWDRGIAALRRWVADHGYLPTGACTVDGLRLDRWINQRRREYRAGTLSADRIALLEGIAGWTWDSREAQFDVGFHHLMAWLSEHGNCTPPSKARIDGFAVGAWVAQRRRDFREGRLSQRHALRLESLPGWSWGTKRPRGVTDEVAA